MKAYGLSAKKRSQNGGGFPVQTHSLVPNHNACNPLSLSSLQRTETPFSSRFRRGDRASPVAPSVMGIVAADDEA